MADEGRQRRIAERIRVSVTNTLDRKVKDPRLGFLTITDVRVTGDLQHATIFYTVMGDETVAKQTRRALESVKGLVRSEVGSAIGLRLTPTISFQPDSLPESAASIEDALRAAKARDAAIAAEAAGKSYAAGESPYREERSIEQDEDVSEDQAEQLKELDTAWGQWTDGDKSDAALDTVEENLEDPGDKLDQAQQFEADLEDSADDLEPGGTPQV